MKVCHNVLMIWQSLPDQYTFKVTVSPTQKNVTTNSQMCSLEESLTNCIFHVEPLWIMNGPFTLHTRMIVEVPRQNMHFHSLRTLLTHELDLFICIQK